MIEVGMIMALCVASAAVGICFSEIILERNRRRAKETKLVYKKAEEKEEQYLPQENKIALRNGYGVTRDKNPSFAEQWVNIMNYNGESQLEEDYEEGENVNSAEYMGRVS